MERIPQSAAVEQSARRPAKRKRGVELDSDDDDVDFGLRVEWNTQGSQESVEGARPDAATATPQAKRRKPSVKVPTKKAARSNLMDDDEDDSSAESHLSFAFGTPETTP